MTKNNKFSIEQVVTLDIDSQGNVTQRLTFQQWIAFTLWPGMRPSIFACLGSRPREGARPVVGAMVGMNHLATGQGAQANLRRTRVRDGRAEAATRRAGTRGSGRRADHGVGHDRGRRRRRVVAGRSATARRAAAAARASGVADARCSA